MHGSRISTSSSRRYSLWSNTAEAPSTSALCFCFDPNPTPCMCNVSSVPTSKDVPVLLPAFIIIIKITSIHTIWLGNCIIAAALTSSTAGLSLTTKLKGFGGGGTRENVNHARIACRQRRRYGRCLATQICATSLWRYRYATQCNWCANSPVPDANSQQLYQSCVKIEIKNGKKR